ncbi:7182_t:CDS:2, partial [Acaulospora colombiana]
NETRRCPNYQYRIVSYQIDTNSISRTSRKFNDFCIPFLYHDINLLDNDIESEYIALLSQYTHHVRTIRLVIDPPHRGIDDAEVQKYEPERSALIERCSEVTSVALYFNNHLLSIGEVGPSILKLIQLGNIRSFGIYSQRMLQEKFVDMKGDGDLVHLLESILGIPEMIHSLKYLDIVMGSLSPGLYAQVRALVASLTSLTMRQPLSYLDDLGWEISNRLNWSPSTQMQRLNLVACSGALIYQIPALVGHFKSLRYLLTSSCGSDTDIRLGSRSPGWSHSPHALCNQHIPLEEFHIECMDELDIFVMGTIPVQRLIITRISALGVIEVLQKDQEIFPSLRYLSLNKEMKTNHYGKGEWRQHLSTMLDLEAVCRQRNIALSFDADNILNFYVSI